MAGLVGSLAMLLEPGRLGVSLDLDLLPAPDGVPLADWLACFPCLRVPAYAARPSQVSACLGAFADRDLTAAALGVIDDTGRVRLRRASEMVDVFDLGREGVTNLRPVSRARASSPERDRHLSGAARPR